MAESNTKRVNVWAKELGVPAKKLHSLLQEAGHDIRSIMSEVSEKEIATIRDKAEATAVKSPKKEAAKKDSPVKEKGSAEGAKPKAKAGSTKTVTETGDGLKVIRTRRAEPDVSKAAELAPKKAVAKPVAAKEAEKVVADKKPREASKTETPAVVVEKKIAAVAEPAVETAPPAPKKEEKPAEKVESAAVKAEASAPPAAEVTSEKPAPAAEKPAAPVEGAGFKAKVQQPTEEMAAKIALYNQQREQQKQRRAPGGARPAGGGRGGPRRDNAGFTGSYGRPAAPVGARTARPAGPGGFGGGPRSGGAPFPGAPGSVPGAPAGAPGGAPGAAGRPGGHGSGPRGSSRRRQKTPFQKEREERFDPKQSVNRVMASLSKGSSRQHYERRSAAQDVEVDKKELHVSDFITVNELAGLLRVSAAQVVAKCMELGMMVTINYRIDFDTIQLLAAEFGYEAKLMDEYEDVEGEEEAQIEEALVARPPVVTVMGHADHGKTSLLDYVRKTRIAKGEAGGITQHVGAYQVETPKGPVTFLDTPGHEAFSQMRARGSQITDVVVLVVAADSMVMPQTVESIEHARSANVPLVIAITKCDLETANPDRIRAQLSERGVEVDQWGGDTSCVEVSSKSGLGMDKLLETLALEAEILDLKANPDMAARGVVIESRLDKGKGALATVLVQNGTLRVGDAFAVGNYAGRVRALLNEVGEQMEEVPPGCPCQIMGMDGAPFAGDRLTVYENEKEAREIASKRRAAAKERELRSHQRKQMSDVVAKSGELKVIIKADVDGSAEALTQELEKLSNKEVVVNIIHKAVGNINESDVQLAAASDAVIVAFHLLPAPAVRALAEQQGVEIKMYRVIYDCIEEFQGIVESKLKPIIREEVAGEAEVKQIYRIPKVGIIAGSVVTNGVVDLEAKLRIYRKGREVGEGVVSSLKRHQDEVKSVKVGLECGIGISGFDDLQVDDTLAFFKEVKIKRTLKDLETT